MAVKVLLLTQWFEPEPTFKGLVFAKELIKQGVDVEVVTGFPNYPGGKLYEGYKVKPILKEVFEGVNVTRVPLYPSHDRSVKKRALNYISFAVSALAYCLFRRNFPDVLYAYHPPLTVGIAAALIRMFRRVPVVYDIQDMWPDSLRATGMLPNERLISVIGKVASWVYSHVDQLVVLSPGFKRLLVERGVPPEKIKVIFNWCDESSLDSAVSDELYGFPSDGYFRVLFAGNMGSAQALNAVIDAANLVRAQNNNVRLVFLGGGLEAEHLKSRSQAMALDNVVFLPPVPMQKVGSYLKQADALLVHLRKDPLFETTIPSKTQAYMAMGRPIIMGVGGDAADLVRNADCGITVESENSGEIANAILSLAGLPKEDRNRMGHNARGYYMEHLSRTIGTQNFVQLFSHLINIAKPK